MTRIVFDPEQHGGPGWAGLLAWGVTMRQQEADRLVAERAAAEAKRREEDARLEEERLYFDQLAAQAMNVDLSQPWALGFARWINLRYGQRAWPEFKAGTEGYKYEIRLFLRAETAKMSGNYALYTTLFNSDKYKFPKPRTTRQRREPPAQNRSSSSYPEKRVVGA